MEFQYEPRLLDYMEQKNKRTILVELVEINSSDLDITELHVRFVDARLRDQFLTKKKYRLYTTPHGEVLLPRFPLKLEEPVRFGLKSFLCFHSITYSGIRL